MKARGQYGKITREQQENRTAKKQEKPIIREKETNEIKTTKTPLKSTVPPPQNIK